MNSYIATAEDAKKLNDGSNLNLVLKGEWFDMILSGEKLEEYREIKAYWINRLLWHEFHEHASCLNSVKDCIYDNEQRTGWTRQDSIFKHFDTITFRHGYSKTARTMVVECKGIHIGLCRPEWSVNMQGEHFVLSSGKMLKTENI